MRAKAEKCLKFSFSQKKNIPLTMALLDALYTSPNVLENDHTYSLASPRVHASCLVCPRKLVGSALVLNRYLLAAAK